MKKIFLMLLALVATMSINAQVVELMKNGEVVAKFTADQVDKVVFKKSTVTGTAEATIGGVKTIVNWVQLWKGGPKFAEYNVGATSVTEYGGYYTWGGTFANGEGVWNDYYNDGESNLSCTGDNITDTATNLWGSNWRMPTQAELDNKKGGLLNECECVWTENYKGTGVNGLLCTGKGAYSSNSVFLPAAGNCFDGGDVCDQGDFGFYWSSTPSGSDSAYDLYFNSGHQSGYNDYRSCGCSVRAVLNENQ